MHSHLRLARSPRLTFVAVLFAIGAAPRVAWADPPDTVHDDSDDAIHPTLRRPVDDELPASPKLFLDLTAAVGMTEERVTVATGLVLTGTFDDLFVPPRFVRSAAQAKNVEEPAPAPPEPETAPREPPARVPAIDGTLARGVVRSALAAARSDETASTLDDLSTRARASGAIPELRVRVARVVDEGQSLSPTEYDPERVTASGGTSLWLEGRASFQLDRLVFASDEIAIQRLRAERARFERELTDDVLAALAGYEKARAVLDDEAADADAQIHAEVDLAVWNAKLDVMTDGWFGRHVQVERDEADR